MVAIKLLSVAPAQNELIDKAITLGNRYTKTLGLLKPPAYSKAAEDGGLLVAVEADEVIGYALFGLPKRSAHIRLAHLCVAEEQRGRSIARRLVEEIKKRYPQRLGIKAKCRRDYNLSAMWTSLGFVPHGEVRGRGRAGEILDGWWLDLGHPHLFTEVESDALLVVAVDHGVFADLRGLTYTTDVEESRALEAGWMTDLVELAYTPQLVHQIRDIADTAERQHQRAALSGLRQLAPAPAAVAERTAELLSAATESLSDLPDNPCPSNCRAMLFASVAGSPSEPTNDETSTVTPGWRAARSSSHTSRRERYGSFSIPACACSEPGSSGLSTWTGTRMGCLRAARSNSLAMSRCIFSIARLLILNPAMRRLLLLMALTSLMSTTDNGAPRRG